jgi:hypothetical protein
MIPTGESRRWLVAGLQLAWKVALLLGLVVAARLPGNGSRARSLHT